MMEEDTGGASLSVYDEPFEMEEEEKKVEVGKVEEVAEVSPIHTGPRLQFNYEVVRTLCWIFGLTLILVFALARWSINQNKPILREQVIIIQPDIRNESYDFFFDSKQLSFLWRFCNRTTFECSWCPPGWTEHDSRCYLMFNYTEKWAKAQEICSHYLGHLPIVLNARDQILLTRMAIEYRERNFTVHGVWIGLKDTETEGNFTWVNGKMLTSNDSFWQPGNPNNMIPFYDKLGEGQDCVAIVPPKNYKKKGWYYTWDDVICRGERHFICEIQNFPLKVVKYGSWERVIQHSNDKSHAESRTTT